MTKDISDLEIRKLPKEIVIKLSQILDIGGGWKDLMSVIPKECKEGNPLKYTSEHTQLIESAGMCQKRSFTEILLDEWGTSGRCRPTVSYLLECLIKAEHYRAADYVAVELLNRSPPTRPKSGPAAKVEYPAPRSPENLPSTSSPGPSQSKSTDTPQSSTNLDEELDNIMETLRLSYAELESATECFDPKHILGSGAWGSVYVANLPQLGTVAVKRLRSTDIPGDPEQQFLNEVQVLAHISHPNLLSLMGYSIDGPALCVAYKYMENGSLLDQLACKKNIPLPWVMRIEIALGSARGIHYLHTAFEHPLVHRDIKSANILLDCDFTPKVGDFGLVRLGSSGNTTRSWVMTSTVIGTSAYMAPEAHRGDVSVKMDVFSFGVVLLELLTGLPPYDETREGHDLVTHVDCVDDPDSLVDTKAGNWPQEIVTNMFELASHCHLKKSKRPLMSTVVDTLETFIL